MGQIVTQGDRHGLVGPDGFPPTRQEHQPFSNHFPYRLDPVRADDSGPWFVYRNPEFDKSGSKEFSYHHNLRLRETYSPKTDIRRTVVKIEPIITTEVSCVGSAVVCSILHRATHYVKKQGPRGLNRITRSKLLSFPLFLAVRNRVTDPAPYQEAT